MGCGSSTSSRAHDADPTPQAKQPQPGPQPQPQAAQHQAPEAATVAVPTPPVAEPAAEPAPPAAEPAPHTSTADQTPLAEEAPEPTAEPGLDLAAAVPLVADEQPTPHPVDPAPVPLEQPTNPLTAQGSSHASPGESSGISPASRPAGASPGSKPNPHSYAAMRRDFQSWGYSYYSSWGGVPKDVMLQRLDELERVLGQEALEELSAVPEWSEQHSSKLNKAAIRLVHLVAARLVCGGRGWQALGVDRQRQLYLGTIPSGADLTTYIRTAHWAAWSAEAMTKGVHEAMAPSELQQLRTTWETEWYCLPQWSFVLQARDACGEAWAGMSGDERRTSCEFVVLFGPEAALRRPSPEALHEGSARSSSLAFVTQHFTRYLIDAHLLHVKPQQWYALSSTYEGGAPAWTVPQHRPLTTAEVCKYIVVPATRAYGMSYVDLFLGEKRSGLPQYSAPLENKDGPDRAFISHAWGLHFEVTVKAVDGTIQTGIDEIQPKDEHFLKEMWIDIFCKNQHVPIRETDLTDSMHAAGAVHVVLHPWPDPLVLTRVWCLFEIAHSLSLGITTRLHHSMECISAMTSQMGTAAWEGSLYAVVDPKQMEAQLRDLDVRVIGQATVPSDRDMIFAIISAGMGFDKLHELVRDLFMKKVEEVHASQVEENVNRGMADVGCFGGDGIVQLAAGGDCRVEQLRPGMQILGAGGQVVSVVLVTVDPVPEEGMLLCRLPAAATPLRQGSSLLVTPDHPVWVAGASAVAAGCCGVEDPGAGGCWRLPRDLVPMEVLRPEEVPYGAVFNLEIRPAVALKVSGVSLVSLGQDSSLEPRQGVDPGSDALWGWGWVDNPVRARQLAVQEARWGAGRRAEPEALGWLAGAAGEGSGAQAQRPWLHQAIEA